MRGVGYITDRKLGPSKAKPTVVGINLDKPSHVNGTAAKKTHVKINGQNKVQSTTPNTETVPYQLKNPQLRTRRKSRQAFGRK